MKTSREIVTSTLRFENTERMPYDLQEQYGTDFAYVGMSPSPGDFLSQGVDEWGAVWENVGNSIIGQVKDNPLKDWEDFAKLIIPDIDAPKRWHPVISARKEAGNKFLLGYGISIYERLHFLRGLENVWMDIYQATDKLCELINILVEMNLVAIEKYANAGFDGYILADDWGWQDRLTVSAHKWKEIWKPQYERIFRAAHKAGMHTFLHSCGHIVDIIDDFIEIGLDAINMDQQENMGLEVLGKRFAGRINFFCPVDIQNTMAKGSPEEIRAYCRKMITALSTPRGGFMPRWYADPLGAGHSQKAVDAMCAEFLSLSNIFRDLCNIS